MDAIATPESKANKLLRRYTDLAAAIDLLAHRRIVLLDPTSWDDRNDSYFIQKYKTITQAQSVLALCLSSVGETYHHWRVFCGHSSGVCIELYRDRVLSAIASTSGIRTGPVKYMTLGEIEKSPPELTELPFVKRWAFRHEQEYRLIYESLSMHEIVHPVDVPLSAIQGITLSPWLPPGLLDATEVLLNSIPGCSNIKISRSELISNEQWKRNADRLLEQHLPTALFRSHSDVGSDL